MRIALLNMPVGGSIAQPYSAVSYLAGSLQASGFDVAIRDLNLDAADDLLSESSLGRARDLFRERYLADEAGGASGRALGARRNQAFYERSAHWVENVEAAKGDLRHPERFFDPIQYRANSIVLQRGYDLLTRAHRPTLIGPTHHGRPPHGVESSEQIARDAARPEENIFFDFFTHDVIPWLEREQPGMIGLSVTFGAQLMNALHLATLIRRSSKLSAQIVAGGGHISAVADLLPSDTCLFDHFDFLVLRDGETAIVELASIIEGRPSAKPIEEVPNLLRRVDGELAEGPFHQEELSLLAPPDYRPTVDWPILAPHPVYLIDPTRGCFAKCGFCAVALYNRVGGESAKPYRVMAVDRLMEHIAAVMALQPDDENTYVYFSDDTIAVKLLDKIADALIENGFYRRLRWIALSRLDKGFTPEVCEKLYRAGCREIFFGMESGNQRVLDLMQKNTQLPTMTDGIKNLRRSGVGVFLSLIVGFPGETEQEAHDTLRFVLEHEKYVFAAQFNAYVLAKDSPAWFDPERHGIDFERAPGEDLRLGFPEYRVRGGLDSKQVDKLARTIRRSYYAQRPSLFDGVEGFELMFDARSLLYLDQYGQDRLLSPGFDAAPAS